MKPQSGTTAMLRYDAEIPSRDLCEQILRDTGVLLTPVSAIDMEGYLRIGYANDTEVLVGGLARLADIFAKTWTTDRSAK